ncbi:immunoglobulin superfamily containing leucine-rich repeat protein 2 [Hyla sarda]|uniref:immunoglobulin superfamily containing leucine-rich repeat protein 2 n=1 Tax=Hyla sarda TaxID=327740 RepID=UPI0024C4177D|nr:immunoglobulin superfamily containing leucine-rich repeat protein 2 [Hyla sarda]XP_056428727.1 immunoglobulin superfamily containing leucine-rich repeat protein 2 [Hyla sarda]XP_056428728.1 immunoglobulin superfamily containing leucine-rich repeat protein 2 [Hyla sarda]XP_056428729.1 immunoglobulin superfamily containing leucine-rich repeat protein 2 [Hyla sarda]
MGTFLFLYVALSLLRTAFTCPEACSCVDKYNQQFADCTYKKLLKVPNGFPSNVTTLSLSANKISALKKSNFVGVPQVTSLWLAHNDISSVERGTLTTLIYLKNLDISFNQLVEFPWEDLASLPALQLIKMNNNRMVNLPLDAFKNLKDLRSLRINNNNFTVIREGTFKPLLSLLHIQIYNNPFQCTCSLIWLKKWIEEAQITVAEKDLIVCASPADLQGKKIIAIPDLPCMSPTVQLSYHPNLDNTELYDGFTLSLHCLVSGSPKPTIQWKVRNSTQETEIKTSSDVAKAELSGNFLVYQNGTLVIPHLSKKLEGAYTCIATNEMGSSQGSVNVSVAGSQKNPTKVEDPAAGKTPKDTKKPTDKDMGNSVLKLDKTEEKLNSVKPTVSTAGTEDNKINTREDSNEKKCGPSVGGLHVSNHAFNESSNLKPHVFDLGVIALDVSEKDAKVQITPYNTHFGKQNLKMLYLCQESPKGYSLVQWSEIEDQVNSYWFQGLTPGTNYSVCLTYKGEDCHVQVVFTTKKEVPSLIIIIIVSIFLLGLATIPLVGATCCHLLSKYHGKNYKLIMKTQKQDPMEKHMAADFDPRSSYVESEKNFDPNEAEGEEGETEGVAASVDVEKEVEGSVLDEALPTSQSKTNQEDFEVGSEYSDKLPLGAEAVTISEEINGNYKDPAR